MLFMKVQINIIQFTNTKITQVSADSTYITAKFLTELMQSRSFHCLETCETTAKAAFTRAIFLSDRVFKMKTLTSFNSS